jgi:class 3 adenylate cyclase/tetratricopeptide (TPR) repeat protein
VICPNCSTENDAGSKFCNECGAPLAAACPNCGATNKPGAKFCNECGTTLTAASASTTAPVTGAPAANVQIAVAERRVVTVLFADLVGFTPFAEERDAEDVREALSSYFDLCSQIVGRYGGTIEKFIGDAIMAVWGAPVAHEDDAERAVRAALELIDAVKRIAANVNARAGVLTGEAAVTIGAMNQGMVAGDMVNTASRLQSVAPTGSVLVGEATFRAANSAVVFEEAGAQLLKGKELPVPAWRAIRVVAEVGGRNRQTEGLEPPFVGRADEFQLLKDLLHATGRERRVRLVSVMGPAGIGKSRLAWEFLKYVDGLVETTYWHSGRSPAYGEGITFWALGEMVRGRCGLTEMDDEATTRAKVTETVGTWISDEAERAWIEKGLLTLLGLESDLPSDQLFAAWRTFFERISELGTVAMVFEDTHHADSGLLDFIEHMLEWSRGHPIYILTLARPELLDKRPDWGAGKRNFSSVYLEPLSEAEMHELLLGLIPGLPERALKTIVDRADGIPLYAVETVRMLVADGRLQEKDGTYEPLGELATLAVPETLTALISSRLDALEAGDRALVHDAAVIGQSFTLDALSAVSDVAQGDLEARLKGLIRRELMTREVDVRSSEVGQYAFVQALIREVAYNTLSKKDRKTRHLAAARYFEQLGSDELASALAGHYLAAHQNASEGPEADALAAQARVALRGAAERAATLGAHDQAIVFLEQAISVTAEATERAVLLERAAESARIAGNFDLSARMLRDAVDIWRGSVDRLSTARATAKLVETLLIGRRDSEGLEVAEAAEREFADLWPDPAIAAIKANLARAVGQFGDNRRAIALADEVLEVAEHGDYPDLLCRMLIGKGAALGAVGRLREGVAVIRAGEEIARQQGLTERILEALTVRGFVLGEIDNVEAYRCYREGLDLARRVGHRSLTHGFINNVGYTSFLTGDWDYGLSEMDAVLAEDLDSTTRTWILSNELIIRVARGEHVKDRLDELDQLAARHTDPQIAAAPMDTKANAAQAAGRLQDARRHWLASAGVSSYAPASYYQAARPALWLGDLEGVKSSLAGLEETGFHGPVVEARRATLRAGIAALEGRTADALAGYKAALAVWRSLRVVWEEALTGLDMATVLDPTIPEVRAVAESSGEIFQRLGATPYVERLNAGRTGTTEVAEPLKKPATQVPVESA